MRIEKFSSFNESMDPIIEDDVMDIFQDVIDEFNMSILTDLDPWHAEPGYYWYKTKSINLGNPGPDSLPTLHITIIDKDLQANSLGSNVLSFVNKNFTPRIERMGYNVSYEVSKMPLNKVYRGRVVQYAVNNRCDICLYIWKNVQD